MTDIGHAGDFQARRLLQLCFDARHAVRERVIDADRASG
jgi:hypothetical protein